MSQLEIIREEDSKYHQEVQLQQEVTPLPRKKEGRIKRIVSHLMGPDGYKAVIQNTIEHQLKPSLRSMVGMIMNTLFQSVQRTIYDLIFGIGEGERMMRHTGGLGLGFGGSSIHINGAANTFHKAYKSPWDRSLTDSQRTQARDDLWRRQASQPEIEYFHSYAEAEDFRNRLMSHASTIGYITVNQYYGLCGRDTTGLENNYGWFFQDIQNLSTIEHGSRGYYVFLPPTTYLRK